MSRPPEIARAGPAPTHLFSIPSRREGMFPAGISRGVSRTNNRGFAVAVAAIASSFALLDIRKRRALARSRHSAHDRCLSRASALQDDAVVQGTRRETILSRPPFVVFISVFVHLLGFTMNGPIMPALRAHFQISASQAGLIASCFPLGVFVAVFIFPVLSDIVGRKPVLVVSYVGVGLGILLQALAVRCGATFRTFLILRVFSGLFGGASTVVKAYIADVSSDESLPQNMAWRESAATLAFIVGPALGGSLLALCSLQTVIAVEGFLSVFAGILLALTLTEPNRKIAGKDKLERSQIEKVADSTDLPHSVLGRKSIVPIMIALIMSCIYNFASSFFDGYFAMLSSDRFELSAPAIGSVQTFIAVVVLSCTTVLYAPVVRRFGLIETAVLGLLLIAASFVSMSLPRSLIALCLAVLPYSVGVPFFSPSVPTLLTRCAPQQRRGLILGINSALNTVGRILAPVMLGGAYERSPTWAFGLVGLVVGFGAVVMAFENKFEKIFRGPAFEL